MRELSLEIPSCDIFPSTRGCITLDYRIARGLVLKKKKS